MTNDEIRGSVDEEILLAGSARGRWHSEYLGRSYRSAVEMALALVRRPSPVVLKTDLWNECLGGDRDVLAHLQEKGGYRLFGVDVAHAVCTGGRARVAGAHVVQADIAALPFRTSSIDVVLDLSTLDHLAEWRVAQAIGEYRRVLRDRGVLLIVFWTRNLLMRARLLVKRLLGRREKEDQRYFAREVVSSSLRDGLIIVREFVAGLLLIPPQRLTGVLLGAVPSGALGRLLGWLIRIEHAGAARPLLRHAAGLYGIAAIRQL